jgi:hypothetical protein
MSHFNGRSPGKEGIDERARSRRLGYVGSSCHMVDIAIFNAQRRSRCRRRILTRSSL